MRNYPSWANLNFQNNLGLLALMQSAPHSTQSPLLVHVSQAALPALGGLALFSIIHVKVRRITYKGVGFIIISQCGTNVSSIPYNFKFGLK
jgi:hypothetical protein